MKTTKWIEGRSKPFLLIASLLLIFLIGIIDYFTGPEIALTVCYLLPVGVVVWYVGRDAGVILLVASALTWFVIDVNSPQRYSYPAVAYWNTVSRLGLFLIVSLTLSALREALTHERELARTDFLTGVANYRAFSDLVEMEIERARRFRHPFSVAYLDIDDFKLVNDHYGHNTGDAVLRTVAGTLQNSVRTVDVVARLGGDEFAIFLPETDYDSANPVGTRMQENLREAVKKHGWPVTFSIGMVTFEEPPPSVQDAINRVDQLMYAVKTSSKDLIRHEKAA